jgi:hypothetical protein
MLVSDRSVRSREFPGEVLMKRLSTWATALTLTAALFAATAPAASAELRAPSIKGCQDWRGAVAGITGWAKSTSDCALFGNNSTRVGYSWAVQAGSNALICVQGLGFVTPASGPKKRKWYSMGCGSSGSGTAPWGNAAAYPEVRARIQWGVIGLYRWRH